ncbi:focal adhesion kinase 1-like isoform X4 [Portunus trituberculatus]|uniref:focal adhesion kinase 1-like isoform X4 n=1 Tax=Portunus trituberculatus TaxID=210409 RepID=UPI001E1CDE77|nr:focal adhesion kinase 1-like isoform X4 [Portunus trituberculatus]
MFALRLRNIITREVNWLHHDLTMAQVESRYPNLRGEDTRLELRVRYILGDLPLLYSKDRHTFNFFYEQVKSDYLEDESKAAEAVDLDTAIQLACLEIKRVFKRMNGCAMDKKSNIEHLEKEVGLHKFLPNHVLNSTKQKTVRKALQGSFKKYATFSDYECHFKFLEILGKVRKYDVENFRCALGCGWSIPVTLLVGPSVGISYRTDSASTAQHMANFEQIQSVETLQSSCEQHKKALVQFKVAGTTEALTITCPSIGAAESLADIVDGYCRLANQSNVSLWTVWGSGRRSGGGGVGGGGGGEDYAEIVDDEGDYSTPASRDYELNRASLQVGAIIGEGQFGDVHKGHYRLQDGTLQPVAIKTCKEIEEEGGGGGGGGGGGRGGRAEKFLEEAYVMQQFDHPHIIKLVGIVSGSPFLIVMELARHGELRAFLQTNREILAPSTLLLYTFQLSTALSYLESKKFVHRDIAARNVLVSAHDCVKLGDFGLSR